MITSEVFYLDHTVGANTVRLKVLVEVDMLELAKTSLSKAASNQSGETQLAHGSVKVRVV